MQYSLASRYATAVLWKSHHHVYICTCVHRYVSVPGGQRCMCVGLSF